MAERPHFAVPMDNPTEAALRAELRHKDTVLRGVEATLRALMKSERLGSKSFAMIEDCYKIVWDALDAPGRPTARDVSNG